MTNYGVGAGILSIITESLYDNPIVVFREYAQNAADAIFSKEDTSKCEIKIWINNNDLFFLDNGTGITESSFEEKMTSIGSSNKTKQANLGYKGIGRLSGVPYCEKLIFVNISNYLKGKAQSFSIDGNKFKEIKNRNRESQLSWDELIDEIGSFNEKFDLEQDQCTRTVFDKNKAMFANGNTGFLVILKNISPVLKATIEDNDFFEKLQWLLPVDFDKELYDSKQKDLYKELTEKRSEGIAPIKFCKISYNDIPIFRPIKESMIRKFLCKSNFKFAVGFHTFNNDKIQIDNSNAFSGIRIYIDNMLLCDEKELLQGLDNYGLLAHTSNGQLQSVKGIGAMIYITDKVNISANARRTFIEVTDNDSLDFLRLLAEFVNTIYDTRYALSNYASAKIKHELNHEELQKIKDKALENLRKMAREEIELPPLLDEQAEFDKMDDAEKRRSIKRRITTNIDKKIKEYVKELKQLEINNAYELFISWLEQN